MALTVERWASSKDLIQRGRAAARQDCPKVLLAALSEDADYRVRGEALGNPGIPVEALERFFARAMRLARKRRWALRRPYWDDHVSVAAGNQAMTGDLVVAVMGSALVDELVWGRAQVAELMVALIRSRACTVGVLQWRSIYPDWVGVRAEMGGSALLSAEFAAVLAVDPCESVRARVAANSVVDPVLVEAMLRVEVEPVLMTLSHHKLTGPLLQVCLERLLVVGSTTASRARVADWTENPDVVAAVYEDPAAAVRRAAGRNPAAPDYVKVIEALRDSSEDRDGVFW